MNKYVAREGLEILAKAIERVVMLYCYCRFGTDNIENFRKEFPRGMYL